MWSPEGYYSWSEVLNTFFDISRQILSLVCKGGEPNYTTDGNQFLAHTAEFYLKNGDFAENYAEAELIVGIMTTMLLVSYLEEYPPVLASLDGSAVHARAELFSHRDQLDLCHFEWPVKSQPEFFGFFKAQRDVRFDSAALLDRFAFVDGDTGEIQQKNGGKHHLINGLGLDDATSEAVIALITRLSGYVVCWQEFPDGQELRDFLSCVDANETFTKALNHEFGPPSSQANNPDPKGQKKRLGRPSKRDEAGRAYWTHFPDGHSQEGKSWKEALATVNEAIKVPISEDTVKRAVRDTQ